jgi:hypothetical protein
MVQSRNQNIEQHWIQQNCFADMGMQKERILEIKYVLELCVGDRVIVLNHGDKWIHLARIVEINKVSQVGHIAAQGYS